MKMYNCPNCGAPIGYSEICQYCGTRLSWVPFTSVKVEICPKTIVPLENVMMVPFEAKAVLPPEDYTNMVYHELSRKVAEVIPEFMEIRSMDRLELCSTEIRARLLVCK